MAKFVDTENKDEEDRSELKGLQDSLSHYFTPSNQRRSRVAQSSFSIEKLSTDVRSRYYSGKSTSAHHRLLLADNTNEKDSNMKPCSSKQSVPESSPDRRNDASSLYPRSVGKKHQLSQGGDSSMFATRYRIGSGKEKSSNRDVCGESAKRSPIKSINSAAVAQCATGKVKRQQVKKRFHEFPSKKRSSLHSPNFGESLSFGGRNTMNSVSTAIFSGDRLKEEVKDGRGETCSMQSGTDSSFVERTSSLLCSKSFSSVQSIKAMTAHSAGDVTQNKVVSKSAKKKTSLVMIENSDSGDRESFSISPSHQKLFDAARERALRGLDVVSQESAAKGQNTSTTTTKFIRMGGFLIETWFSSPYPEEYAQLSVLYLCEFCAKYMKNDEVARRHALKCNLRHPPGDEIYRCNNLSVFEVDGNNSRIYCQNICLLAKLFLDHKTLYYDVEPFLFYVLARNDRNGASFVGYFSKEKYSAQRFNLSCIMTLPCFQKHGYGRFLIDFSYLLSRREGMVGTPERPLSELGLISYRSYWKSGTLEYFHTSLSPKDEKKLSIMGISRATGIAAPDVTEVLQDLGFFEYVDSNLKLTINWTLVEKHWESVKSNKNRIWLDKSKLSWSPKIYTPTKDFAVCSPTCNRLTLSPKKAPISPMRSLPTDKSPNSRKFLGRQKSKWNPDEKVKNVDVKQCFVANFAENDTKYPLKKKVSKLFGSGVADECNDTEKISSIVKRDISRIAPVTYGSHGPCGHEKRDAGCSVSVVRYENTQKKRLGKRGANREPAILQKSRSSESRLPLRPRKKISMRDSSSSAGDLSGSDYRNDESDSWFINSDSKRKSDKALKFKKENFDGKQLNTNGIAVSIKLDRNKRKAKRSTRRNSYSRKSDPTNSLYNSGDLFTVDKSKCVNDNISSKNSAFSSNKRKISLIKHRIRSNNFDDQRHRDYRSSSSSDIASSSSEEDLPSKKPYRRRKKPVFNKLRKKDTSINRMQNDQFEVEDVHCVNQSSCERAPLSLESCCSKQSSEISEQKMEVALHVESESPPTLEASDCFDDKMHSNIIVNSPELEEQVDGFECSSEMPHLPTITTGESNGEGEDEDAPPKLSPNYEQISEAETDENCFNDIAPELIEIPSNSRQRTTDVVKDSHSISQFTAFAAKMMPTGKNNCEMVNLGGDAGSEDLSEGEGAESGSSRNGACAIMQDGNLEAESSALDRPPKAPAMYHHNDDHDLIQGGQGENLPTYSKEHQELDSSVDRQAAYRMSAYQPRVQQLIVTHSPVSTTSSVLSNAHTPQAYLGSSTCSIQQQSVPSTHQSLTPHTVSPNPAVFMNSVENNVSPGPATPHLMGVQSQHHVSRPGSVMYGSPAVVGESPEEARRRAQSCSSLPPVMMSNSIQPAVVMNSSLPQSATNSLPPTGISSMSSDAVVTIPNVNATLANSINRNSKSNSPSTSLLTHQSTGRRSSRKDHVRVARSMNGSRIHANSQMSSLPYVISGPSSSHSFAHQFGPPSVPPQSGSYYHPGYHTGRPPYFEPQLYSNSLPPGASQNYPHNISPYPIQRSSKVQSASPMHNNFSYSYQPIMHQPGHSVVPSGSGTSSHVPQHVLGVQYAQVQNGPSVPASTTWRYSNNATPFAGGGFMDTFGGGVPGAGNGNQFATLPNQLYPQQYYPYLMPVMRNE